MFEAEGDKKKKVYPRLPDMLGKKDTPYYSYSPSAAKKLLLCLVINSIFCI